MTLSKLLCTENCRVVYSQGWCRSGRSKTVNLFPLKRCKQRGRASPTTHSFSLLFFWPTLLSSLCSTLKETSREKQTNLRTRFLPKSFYEGFGNFIWQPEWAAETDFLLSFSNVPLSNLSLSANMFWENAVLGLMDRIDLILHIHFLMLNFQQICFATTCLVVEVLMVAGGLN